MKSPGDHKIIQIDITNACPHSCSNCTRFCGHHEKPFMMEFDTFKRIVDSLVEFPGMVGIMGGEPTIHPEFERFVEYYASKIGPRKRSRKALEPILVFSDYRTYELSDVNCKRGLWTSLGAGYYRHFELIQEVFEYQCINDHANPGLHQALLISRKELGITDEEWIPLRDKCWIQNLWSSSATPKGGFFCEVAGALDALFKGPGGWKINKNWWKKKPEEFGDQLDWCELCGAALQVPRRQANEEIDDISPELLKKLEKVNSPKLRKKQVAEFNPDTCNPQEYQCTPSEEWYLPEGDNEQRIAGTNKSLYPRKFVCLVFADHELSEEFSETAEQFDQVIIVCRKDSPKSFDAEYLEVDEDASVAEILTQAQKQFKLNDWIVMLDSTITLRDDFCATLRKQILNPGCLFYQKRVNKTAAARNCSKHKDTFAQNMLFLMFNMKAQALRNLNTDSDLFDLWEPHKRIDLNDWFFRQSLPNPETIEGKMLANHMLNLWNTLNQCRGKIMIFGGGQHTHWLLKLFAKNNLPLPSAILDDNAAANASLSGVPVRKPADAGIPGTVLISSNTSRMTEILTRRCREIWGESLPVINPYQHFPDKKYKKRI